jgi:hypothetical protein
MENRGTELNSFNNGNLPFPKRYKEKEVAKIIGKSVSWLQRKRWEGGGIPFVKDGGRVFYLHDDVAEHMSSLTKYNSTSEYQEGGNHEG